MICYLTNLRMFFRVAWKFGVLHIYSHRPMEIFYHPSTMKFNHEVIIISCEIKTNGIILFFKTFSRRPTIATDYFSYFRSNRRSTLDRSTILCSSSKYFLNCDTWTSWTVFISGGNDNLWAWSPIFFVISNDQIYFELRFPFLPNLITPFIDDILINTLAPISNSNGFLY